MAIKRVIRFPSPSLRLPCKPVAFPLSGEVLEHIGDLRDTLAAVPCGVALASNQVAAEGQRLFVVRPGFTGPAVACMASPGGVQEMPEVCINPAWEAYPPTERDFVGIGPLLDEHRSFVEGCLSEPELQLQVKREMWVQLSYQDLEGRRCEVVLQGLLARVCQHECDHLRGILIYDYADKRTQMRAKQDAIRNRKRGR